MIHAVRLRPRNKKIGHGMTTYTSGTTGTRYQVGENRQPSPVYVVTNQAELAELGEFPQFQIIAFENRAQLDEFLENENVKRSREGINEPRPIVRDMSPKATERKIQDNNEPKSTGRKPASAKKREKSKKILEIEEEVREAKEKYDESVEKERAERTQQKWLDNLEHAKEKLEKQIEKEEKIEKEEE